MNRDGVYTITGGDGRWAVYRMSPKKIDVWSCVAGSTSRLNASRTGWMFEFSIYRRFRAKTMAEAVLKFQIECPGGTLFYDARSIMLGQYDTRDELYSALTENYREL